MTGLPFLPFEAPPDKTDYNSKRLSDADRTLIDRALFSDIVSKQGNSFAFSSAELKRHHGNPTSKEVEWDIWKLRDEHAERLLGSHASAARADLTRRAAYAPDNATAMLNAINAYNGDECGCSLLQAPTVTNPMLNMIIRNSQGR